METIQANVIGKKAYSISQFCDDHGISRATYYNLRKVGKGPIEMMVNARKLISIEAAAAWRRAREQVPEVDAVA